MEIKYREEAEAAMIRRVESASHSMVAQIRDTMVAEFNNIIMGGLKDISTEPMDRALSVQKSHSDVFNEEAVLAVVVAFVETKQDDAVRESTQSLLNLGQGSLMERFKTAMGRCRMNGSIAVKLAEKYSTLVECFEFMVEQEMCSSVPLDLMVSHKPVEANNQSNLSREASQIRADFLPPIMNSNTLGIMRPAEEVDLNQAVISRKTIIQQETTSFCIHIDSLRQRILSRDFSFFSRAVNLLLYQIYSKAIEAIESYSLQDLIRTDLVNFVSLLSAVEVRRYLRDHPRLQSDIIKKLGIVLAKVGSIQINFMKSETDHKSLYSAVSSLYQLDCRILGDYLEKEEKKHLTSISIDCCFAFTLKKMITILVDRHSRVFANYVKTGQLGQKKLNLYSVELSLKLSSFEHTDEQKFYQTYNEHLAGGGYFQESLVREHYMDPFREELSKFGEESTGVCIWVTKVLVHELLKAVCKKKKHVSFYGFFSIVLDVNAYFKSIIGSQLKTSRQKICMIGELRVVKRYFIKLITNEMTKNEVKKQSAVFAANRRQSTNYEQVEKCEAFSFGTYSDAALSPIDIPKTFSLNNFVELLDMNTMVS